MAWCGFQKVPFATAFAPDASVEEQTILAAVQRPISVACIGAKVESPRWQDLPSWYVLAQNDRMLVQENQQTMAQRMGARIRAIASDHVPLITAPDAVVQTILDAINTL